MLQTRGLGNDMQSDPINQKEIRTNHNHDEFLESIRKQNDTNREQN